MSNAALGNAAFNSNGYASVNNQLRQTLEGSGNAIGVVNATEHHRGRSGPPQMRGYSTAGNERSSGQDGFQSHENQLSSNNGG
jgi:hypothetical protein